MPKTGNNAVVVLLLTCLPALAQVELPRLACSQEPSLISLNGDTATTIQFNNRTDQTVRIYWRNYNGVRTFYNTLPPGSGYVQQTFVTHPWIVTNLQDQCLVVFEPVPGPGIATIQLL